MAAGGLAESDSEGGGPARRRAGRACRNNPGAGPRLPGRSGVPEGLEWSKDGYSDQMRTRMGEHSDGEGHGS